MISRDEGVALLLYQAIQAHDLPLVHQQPAHPHGVLVEDVAEVVGADVAAV